MWPSQYLPLIKGSNLVALFCGLRGGNLSIIRRYGPSLAVFRPSLVAHVVPGCDASSANPRRSPRFKLLILTTESAENDLAEDAEGSAPISSRFGLEKLGDGPELIIS